MSAPHLFRITRTARLARLLGAVVLGTLASGLAVPTATAQLALPVVASHEALAGTRSELVYTIDLGTLPTRPVLVVEVTPDASHPDIELEVTLSSWVGPFSGPGFLCGDLGANVTYTSPPTVGALVYELSLIGCEPRISTGFWTGKSVDVTVRADGFGSGGAPAEVDVVIRGRTQVPTGTLLTPVDVDLSSYTVYLTPSKDTVVYERTTNASNGGGSYLWAGSDYELIGGPSIFLRRWYGLNSLIRFDIVDSLPFNAQVSNADLSLQAFEVLNGGGTVLLYETGPSSTGGSWAEGNANAAGTEFFGTTGTGLAANWNFRESSSNPWATPGGDRVVPVLGSMSITTTGLKTFSSSALTNAVQGMVDRQDDEDGFILFGPNSPLFFQDRGIRFASSEYILPSSRPQLRVDYSAVEPHADGTLNTGVVSFISEGDDFRWIYDLDQDDILVTSIGGVCEVVAVQPNFLPYTYSYGGAPGYTGLDCCTWQIDSPQTGTTGTGQALFFHNLDPLNPANLPPDSDGDGIFDNCDNCVNRANGPKLGSCVGPAGVAGTCRSDLECWSEDTCQFGQEDADGDFAGDACSVPEPGLGLGMWLGAGLLGGLTRRRARG